jgi:enterobactin synthetase component D
MLNSPTIPYINHIVEKKILGFPGVCYQCSFDTAGYSDSHVRQLLGKDIHGSLSLAVTKRKSEFVAGRYMARLALIALGATRITVGIGANRAPLWPDSFVGSISHSKEYAICAVANFENIRRIGIDVENFLDKKSARDIAGIVLIEPEYTFVGTYSNPNPVIVTLIFSAKESLFKALYPEVGRYFNFDVAQTKIINFMTGTFSLELVKELSPFLPVGSRFEGTFELNADRVFTMITGSALR